MIMKTICRAISEIFWLTRFSFISHGLDRAKKFKETNEKDPPHLAKFWFSSGLKGTKKKNSTK